MNKPKIEKFIAALKNSNSVEEAALFLNVSSKTLRRTFQQANMSAPSMYLPYASRDLTEKQKKRAIQMYSEFGGQESLPQISSELNVPIEKLKSFFKEEGITHSSLPFTKKEKEKKLDGELVSEAQEIRENLLKQKLQKNISEKTKQDAQRWSLFGKEILDHLDQKIKEYKVEKLKLDKSAQAYCAVFSLQDFHWGRWSSEYEVRSSTNFEKQKKMLFEAIEDLLWKIKQFGLPEKLFFAVGGDFFNSDNHKLQTTAGTPQDSYPSHAHIYITGSMLCVEIIDRFRQIFPRIELVPTLGNHDRDSDIALFMFLSAWFKDCFDVEHAFTHPGFDVEDRQYRVYGKTLLVFAHGDGGKTKMMPGIIAFEARKLLSSTDFTFYVSGHFHSRISQDLFGVQHSQVSSIALDDRHHAKKGYISQKALNMFLISKEKGLMAELISNV